MTEAHATACPHKWVKFQFVELEQPPNCVTSVGWIGETCLRPLLSLLHPRQSGPSNQLWSMAMALDAWQYGDPEKVAIRKEEDALRKAKACGDCVHKRSIEFNGEVVHHCIYKRQQYGKRCELYQVVKVTK